MQSDGDVVYDRFNKASRDKDNILYQILKQIYVRILWGRFIIILTFYENAY